MKNIRIKNLKFGSYVKLYVIISFALGFFIGIISFLGSLIGAPVETHFLFLDLQGLPAGIFSIILGPIALAFVGILGAIVSYLPFKYILKILNGISIKGTFR